MKKSLAPAAVMASMMKRVPAKIVLLVGLTIILTPQAIGQAMAVEVHGFWQSNYSARIGGANPADYPGQSASEQKLMRAEERLRLESFPLPYFPDYRAFFKLDLYQDATEGAWKGDLREAIWLLCGEVGYAIWQAVNHLGSRRPLFHRRGLA